MRQGLVFLHRWIGLLMTAFLIVVSVTGSILAFDPQLERLINPQLFVQPRAGEKPLDLASLAERAEEAEPHARVGYFALPEPGSIPATVSIRVEPRIDPSTHREYKNDFDQIFLDPYTGRELGRRRYGDISQGRINIVPFTYRLHTSLALGNGGALVLGIVALAWTIDCFVGFYLTLPVVFGNFLTRWKPAWLVKWNASVFRTNFDLHRAGGLWLWPILFVFAWSSVMFNLSPVYNGVNQTLLGASSFQEQLKTFAPSHQIDRPKLGWRAAEIRGKTVTNELAKKHGFKVLRPFGIGFIPSLGVYIFDVRSDHDVGDRTWETGVWIDGDTGALQKVFLPTGQRTGDRATTWLYALHWADFHNLFVYRVFVFVLGILIVMLSVTGIYIWLRKRRARLRMRARQS